MPGRGAWSVSGRGGTLEYAPDGSTRPGPYYMLADDDDRLVGVGGWASPRANRRAVHGAVIAYQRALNRLDRDHSLTVDGVYGEKTRDAVTRWQQAQPASADIKVWGGIGPSTSKGLLMPTLRATVRADLQAVVCGVVTQESMWDVGAVGFVDEHDVGLAQINAQAHPDMSERERLQPATCFEFVETYLTSSLDALDGNLQDAIASYNLGVGGARSWIRDGRPDVWKSRNVRGYISTILNVCGES